MEETLPWHFMHEDWEEGNEVPQASCPVGMNVVLSCALGQVWWTDNHSCSNCALFTYMSWMWMKLACSCQSMNLLTETFGSSLIQNGFKLFLPLPPYSQKQFIVLFFSNLCYLVKEGWEVRGPDRGYVYPVAGATRPLLGDGCVIQCV